MGTHAPALRTTTTQGRGQVLLEPLPARRTRGLQLATASSRPRLRARGRKFSSLAALAASRTQSRSARAAASMGREAPRRVTHPHGVQHRDQCCADYGQQPACAGGDDDGVCLMRCSRRRSTGPAWRRQPRLLRSRAVCVACSRSPCVHALSFTASVLMARARAVVSDSALAWQRLQGRYGRLFPWGQRSRLARSIFEYVILAVSSLSPHTSTVRPSGRGRWSRVHEGAIQPLPRSQFP